MYRYLLKRWTLWPAKTPRRLVSGGEWRRLYQKVNPKTVARAIRLLAHACSPAKMKEFIDVDPAICSWGQNVSFFLKELHQTVSNKHEGRDGDIDVALEHPGLHLHMNGWRCMRTMHVSPRSVPWSENKAQLRQLSFPLMLVL